MKKILKQNDGYALAYVLVVLLVLAAIAMGAMGLSLNALERQQTSLNQMKDKYAAQGLVEQVVAQLEKLTSEITDETLEAVKLGTTESDKVTITVMGDDYKHITVTGKCENARVIAELELKAIQPEVPSDAESPADPTTPVESDKPEITGYTVTYSSYKTERISNTGGAEE